LATRFSQIRGPDAPTPFEKSELVGKYSDGGSHEIVRRKLKKLRNERLAHRQIGATSVAEADPTDGEIESFYQDMSELIRLLLSLVMAEAYNPADTGGVFGHHAKFFWAGVRGERTEGHPSYREPRNGSQSRH
jgi:hypothetical protein